MEAPALAISDDNAVVEAVPLGTSDENALVEAKPPNENGISEGNQGHGDNLEAENVINDDEDPRVGMKFNSEEDVIRYYMNYSQCNGFGISKISSKNGDDGKRYFTLACSRARKYVSSSKNILKGKTSKRIQCKARLNGCVALDGTVVLSRVVLEHNHELRGTRLHDRDGINVNRNYHPLVVDTYENENLTYGEKDCRNSVDKVKKVRLPVRDVEALRNYFFIMQQKNSQFYYAMDVDDKGHLRNVVWADARCRADYEYFGEVVTFDTTYITNKYDVPFASFVGVNHHGQSVLFGCALLLDGDAKTFIWLFTKWLECMCGRAPDAIITDHDIAMKHAIEVVFPKACHRWCLSHLVKKIPEKFGRRSDYESVRKNLYGVVYDSCSKNDFMKKWGEMIECHSLHDNDWLKGLYDERHRWVPVYVRDTFWAGMSTTQQSESVNSFFDGYVNSKTTLNQFVEQYDIALKDAVEKERLADYSSCNELIDCVSHFGFESQFQQAFTSAKFKEFQVEVASMMYCNTLFEKSEGLNSIFSVVESKKIHEKIKDVKFNVSFNEEQFQLQCTCCLFEFRGILCRHILCVLRLTGKTESVPSNYVLSHWRKDIKQRHSFIKFGFDQQLRKVCDAFYEVASSRIKTDDDVLKMMNWIKKLEIEFTSKGTSPRMSREPFRDQYSAMLFQNAYTMVPMQLPGVFDPMVARSVERLPLKRIAPRVGQIAKRKHVRKRTKENNQKSDSCQNGIKENEVDSVFESQTIDVIDTQENSQAHHHISDQSMLQETNDEPQLREVNDQPSLERYESTTG